MKFFDKYNRTARLYPAIITMLPYLLVSIQLSNSELGGIFQDLLSAKIAGNVTVAVVMIYLLIHINRFFSKEVFERWYFREELNMPTTDFMLFQNDHFSDQYKQQVREKVLEDFGMGMPTRELEDDDELEARKRISEAVGLIRNKIKGGNLLLQHNIEYGFIRNLIGGSILGIISSISAWVYFNITGASTAFIGITAFFIILFLIFLIASRLLINRFGRLYAKRLFLEYLAR